MLHLSTDTADVGNVWDIYESFPDLAVPYRTGGTKNGTRWHEMQQTFKNMQDDKNDGNKYPRNDWQLAQSGGHG
jgi:hypothetical protein